MLSLHDISVFEQIHHVYNFPIMMKIVTDQYVHKHMLMCPCLCLFRDFEETGSRRAVYTLQAFMGSRLVF